MMITPGTPKIQRSSGNNVGLLCRAYCGGAALTGRLGRRRRAMHSGSRKSRPRIATGAILLAR
jgi:hypothetical protein